MKLKFLSSLLLSVTLIGLYVSLNSNSGGIMGKSTSGCGGNGCHGTAASTNTTVALLGVPNPYIAGQTYVCTLSVVNPAKAKAGFDLSCSAGTFSGGTGVMAMGTEIHHTTPVTAISGISAWTFNWKAPDVPSAVTFSYSGNAVDGTSTTANDEWNKSTFTTNGSFNTSVNNIKEAGIAVFPNPVINSVNITSEKTEKMSFEVYNSTGQQLSLPITTLNNGSSLDCTSLNAGTYIIKILANHNTYYKHITKQ